jgi:hypothetical protein
MDANKTDTKSASSNRLVLSRERVRVLSVRTGLQTGDYSPTFMGGGPVVSSTIPSAPTTPVISRPGNEKQA